MSSTSATEIKVKRAEGGKFKKSTNKRLNSSYLLNNLNQNSKDTKNTLIDYSSNTKRMVNFEDDKNNIREKRQQGERKQRGISE